MEGMLDAAGVFGSAEYPVIGTDHTGALQAWNANVARLLHCSKEDALGRNFLDDFVVNAERVKQVWSNACAGIDTVNFDITMRSKSGQHYNMLFNIGACRDESDNIVGVIALGHGSPTVVETSSPSTMDAKDEQKTPGKIERGSAAVIGINLQGAVTIWNQRAASMTGYARGEAVGKNFLDSFLIAPRREKVSQVFTNAFKGHDSSNYEVVIRTKDGQQIKMVLNVAPRSDVGGNVVGAVCLGQELASTNGGDIDDKHGLVSDRNRARSRSYGRHRASSGEGVEQQSCVGTINRVSNVEKGPLRERSRSRDGAKEQTHAREKGGADSIALAQHMGVNASATQLAEPDFAPQCPLAAAGKAAGLTDLEICASVLGLDFGRVGLPEKVEKPKAPAPPPPKPPPAPQASPRAPKVAVPSAPHVPMILRTKWWDEEDVPKKFSKDSWEEPRSKTGLKLISEISLPGLNWTYFLRDESRRSFAGYLKCPLSPDMCEEYFNKVRDGTTWIQPENTYGPIPRKTAWMVAPGCVCPYKYGGVHVEPQVYPDWMVALMREVMPFCGLEVDKGFNQDGLPNACNLNLYEDGSMSVGWHSDDETYFQGKNQDVRIISLSFGVKRCFEIRLNWYDEGEEVFSRKFLGNGDICTMEGMVQKHFEHRVPPEEDVYGARLNITWRWIVKHHSKCAAQYKSQKKRLD